MFPGGQKKREGPQCTRAYAGLAQALLSKSYLQAARADEVIGEARAAANHALEFDPNLSEAYCALGMIQGTYDYDWKGAEKSFHRHKLSPIQRSQQHHVGAAMRVQDPAAATSAHT